ncbi:MAG TPA: hypothetical protein VHH09_08915 [Acidimicrobiales bacterium]|nr:hypothetical protein [Acidimicrobiales bacterium]
MIARRIFRLGGMVVLVASGLDFFIFLWRWEWNRAMVAGVLFLAAEVGLSAAVILDRLRNLSLTGGKADPQVLTRLQETAPPSRNFFAWLSPRQGHAGVFVPVLLGMGVVASALAAVVERLARSTAKPVMERGLAARLGPLSWPSTGLSQPHADPTVILSRPVRR